MKKLTKKISIIYYFYPLLVIRHCQKPNHVRTTGGS